VKKTEAAKRKHTAKGRTAAESKESAGAVVQTVEIFAVARFGEPARFTEEERLLIEPALSKLIEQYGGALEKYGSLLSLVPLMAGVITYTTRLSALAVEQERAKKSGTLPPRSNGMSPPSPPPPAPSPTPMPVGRIEL
jgi:hypothetical protein